MPRLVLFTAIITVLVGLNLSGLSLLYKTGNPTDFHKPLGNTIQVLNAMFYDPPSKTVYGYLPYWTLNKSKYIEYDKLTDIAYFGLRIEPDGSFKTKDREGNPEMGYVNWRNSSDLRKVIENSKAWKIRFALTIINQEDDNIDSFLNCEHCWRTLASNTITELKARGLTDINIDFEHVTLTTPDISRNYTKFVKFMNETLDEEFGDSKVVVAAFADSYKRTRITNPTEIAAVSDGIFVMAYDFHQTTSPRAGPVAPLNGLTYEGFDVTKAIKDFKSNIAPHKLILGVPYYGYNFVVQNPTPDSKRLQGNRYVGFSVSQYYSMIKDSDTIPLTNTQWDASSNTPFVVYQSGNGAMRVLHFENEESLEKKYDFLIREGLGGVGIWALGYDGSHKELWNLLGRKFKG